MTSRKISDCIQIAASFLPRHVHAYILKNVEIFIDRIGTSSKPNPKRLKYETDGVFGFSVDDTPTIAIDSHISTPKRVISVALHEFAHAWLSYRGLKNTERIATLLARHWDKRKKAD